MSNLPIPYNSRQSIFNFEEHSIRTLTDEDGNPWFVATDIAKGLNYANPSQAVTDNVDSDDKAYATLSAGDSGGISRDYKGDGKQVVIINESGLYSLIMKSEKPEAKRFKKWITSEVLPAIRKTGSYSLQKLSPAEFLLQQAQRLVDHERQLALYGYRIDSLEARAQARDQWIQHFTVIGYCNLCGLPALTHNEAISWGKRAAQLSRERGLNIGRVTDPRFGEVNTYHISVLDDIAKE